jgi:predicted ATPase
MARKDRPINLPAPYLKRVWLDPSRIGDRKAYPYCLPFLSDEFELSFDKPITTIVGENGVGKSTLLEGIAVLAGYDEAGGGKGYMPVDHSNAVEEMGGQLSKVLRASCCRRSQMAGSSAPKASSLSHVISTRLHAKTAR